MKPERWIDGSGQWHRAHPDDIRATQRGAIAMPRGDKSKYTEKQKRKAEHIEESYEQRGVPQDEAERRAWATVNAQDGGGKKPGGSGRARPSSSKAEPKSRSGPDSKSG
ncbi:plasmid stabilization protein [Tautonia sociabilis]|uniref:Plasmid stabilization protein n=1 Tax=Tautonia sociabilis TaxID=2080755 RepID=A0A432MEF8_9BACT|nr:plasmid stabilization protein [Tautonia sociabilis]RUL83773.1 plasmid stabilization protein [Tautonia sociabilis]